MPPLLGAVHRAHVDDGAALALHHLARHGLAHQEAAFEVDGDHRVPVGFGDVEKGRSLEDAGVVDQAVHLTETRQRGGQCRIHFGLEGDIAVLVQGLAAAGVQFIRQALAGLVGHVPQRHGSAVAHEAACTGCAYAL